MERITQKDLEFQVEQINNATDSPLEPYNKTASMANKKFTANIGNYHLDYAYGGVKLSQMVNASGGITNISTGGFGTKRELFNWMTAFLAGLAV